MRAARPAGLLGLSRRRAGAAERVPSRVDADAGALGAGEPVDRRWVPLSAVSPRLVASVILSEDGQFCRERGVDFGAACAR